MRDQLGALFRLSEIDASARQIELELQQIPARVEEMRLDVQRLEGLLRKEREQAEEAERLRQAQQEEILRQNDQLARSKAKGAKARNAREVDAAEREMETVRRSVREREQERERLGSAIEQVKQSLAEHEKELEKLKGLFSEEEEKAGQRMAELQGQKSGVLKGREDIVSQLKPNVLRRYEMIRQRRGIGVVEVREGTCQGCQMQLPPQQYIVLQRGETLEQCANCHRILVHRESLDEAAATSG